MTEGAVVLPQMETAVELWAPGEQDCMTMDGEAQGLGHGRKGRASGSLIWPGRATFTDKWKRADMVAGFTLTTGKRGQDCRRPHPRTAGGVGLQKEIGSLHSLGMHLLRRGGPGEVSHFQ